MENQTKSVILIGITGHGKTTLFNRLTGAHEKIQLGTKSITSMITKRLSELENFEVLDTPGLGYNEEKLKNFEGIIGPLQQTEIHRIILVIKHDRIVQMIKQIKSMFEFFKNYKDIITIYISHFEQFRGDVNIEKQLIQTRIQNELKIDSFIYNEEDLTDTSIIKQLNLILKSSKQLPILLSIEEIIECFDVFNLKDCVSIQNLEENFNTQFKIRVYQPIMNFLENFSKQITDPLYFNYYLDILQDFAKQKVKEYFEQFSDKMKNQFQVNKTQQQTFQESLNLKLSQIISKINEKERGHPKIKACPYCGLLQIIENEDNKILCGENTGHSFSSIKQKPYFKFEFKIENMEVKLIEYDIQLFKDKDELIKELLNSIKDQQFNVIINQFNINYENEFIELLQKEFGKSCFDQWIQIMDKRNYNEFIKTITETLIKSMNKPQKRIIGCGKYFSLKEETKGMVNQKEENPPQFIQQSQYTDSNRKRVVLIGYTGSGRTTLFNRLTGAQEKTSSGSMATTRNIILGYSKTNLPEKSFEVMDTPGLGSIVDQMGHISGILAGLIQNTVDRIIFIIRHEKRNELMMREIEFMLKFFKNYKDQITIYISHFDLFYGDRNKEKELIEAEIRNEFNITSFFYNEKQSDASIIQQFNQILKKSQPMSIKFSIEQIIECFDIIDLLDEDELQIDDGKMIQKYRQTAQIPIMNFIDNFPKKITDPLYLNYLDELQNFAKQKVEEFLLEFFNQYGEEMKNRFYSIIHRYVPYIEYYKSLKLELSKIILEIINKKQAHPDFIGNQIKACPYCGLLQVKEQNCNKILCGEGASRSNLSLKLQTLVQFKYQIQNNQVILIENDIQLFKDKDELINKLKDSYNQKQFQQIIEISNIKHDYQFIELLQKEFGNSCFDKWFQIIDKRNYDKFAYSLKELLFQRSQQLKEGTKGKFGCGKYFYWESESLGKLYQIAKPLTKQQIQELNDNDLFTISIIPDRVNFYSDLFQWLRGLEEILSTKINYYLNEMKATPQIVSTGKKTGLKQFHF